MMHTHNEETIIAQCTPTGSGALALIRLSGESAITIADSFAHLGSRKKLIDCKSHTIHYGSIIDQNGHPIDQVLFLVFKKPHTFTGENTIEITCHNNPFIIEQIITQAIKRGARIAQRGEFARRAFLNGKIDLIQAEAINDLIHANTEQALKKSLAQIQGSLSNWIQSIQTELLKARAYCEASFEFIDEEIEFAPHIKENITSILTTISHLKKSFDQQNQIREGIRIAFLGTVNAGKSSLFNALLGKNRAIVTNIAGTTRDVIEAGLYRDGNYWTLVDTAGLRTTDDMIEQQGIERSFDEAQKADIIILVRDASQTLSPPEHQTYIQLLKQYSSKIIEVSNKADLAILSDKAVATSISNPESIKQLECAIQKKVSVILDAADSPYLLNKRQFNILMSLEKQLDVINQMMNQGNIAYELLSYELKLALEIISELTGKSVDEAGMNMIFKEFCVGK
jgi:tRNA modification GTPase